MLPAELELYRPVYRLVNAHWLTLTEAKVATLLEVEQMSEALDAWEEAQAIADAAPPK